MTLSHPRPTWPGNISNPKENLLDGASEQTVAQMLAPLPEPARMAYENERQPAYAALDRWGVGNGR